LSEIDYNNVMRFRIETNQEARQRFNGDERTRGLMISASHGSERAAEIVDRELGWLRRRVVFEVGSLQIRLPIGRRLI
jgi:hypothetical protein